MIKKRKILVVDDDPTILKLLQGVLAHEGFEVSTAKDGIDAMVFVKKHQPDLIILDIMMPELNGYDVCHTLKFDPDYKDIPIIILTSRDQELDPRIGKIMGIDYMQKPLDRALLLGKIQEILK